MLRRDFAVGILLPRGNQNGTEHTRPEKKHCSSVFTALSVIAYCVQIVRPQSGWKGRCKTLLSSASPFTLCGMDVPANWQQLTLWQ